MIDRRSCLRRDLNDLVRDEAGKFSFEKIGTYVGQGIAANYLIAHWSETIKSWDIMTVLFAVLIAPSLFKRLMNMKYGGAQEATVTTATAEVVTTTKGKK